jgi:hypothetical protein
MAEVEIHEEKVFAHLDKEKECDAGTWVMDIGAMNHMSECQAAFTKIDTPHLKKLEDCGCKMIFIGYESGSKVYRMYDPITKRVHVTHDMVLDEQA